MIYVAERTGNIRFLARGVHVLIAIIGLRHFQARMLPLAYASLISGYGSRALVHYLMSGA